MGKPAGTVLIVDDEEDICSSMADVISALIPSLTVRTARDGPSALRILAEEPIDLILTDFQMPGMNGLELLDEVAKKYPHVQALLFTGFPDPTLRKRAVDHPNLLEFYVKPVDPVPLTERIAEALSG